MSAQAAVASTAPKKNNKKGVASQLVFSELEDLFLNTKGKALRNIVKKKAKYSELDKQVRKGEIVPNAQQKLQIQSIPILNDEITELEALCKLYMQSNPTYAEAKVEAAPAMSEEDVAKVVEDAMTLCAKSAVLTALMKEDTSFVECSEGERASMLMVSRNYQKMNEYAQEGSVKFTNMDKVEDFAQNYAKLATSSNDIITASCTYGNLKDFIERSFEDNAQILQRIADLDLKKKREKEAADAKAAAAEAEKANDEDANIAGALADDLADFDDAFGGDYGDECVAQAPAEYPRGVAAAYKPKKPVVADAPKKEAEPVAAQSTSVAPVQEAAAADTQGNNDVPATHDGERRGGRGGRGGRGRGDGEWRGRGGRGGDGERRGRGDNRGRGRGGFRQPREDEDGFVMETGEKPKPRTRGNNYRGRGDGERRGGERGSYRGRGDGERRGGERGARGADWDRRGGRGGRPQTADGGAAAQEQQPAATNGAQASTDGQGQV